MFDTTVLQKALTGVDVTAEAAIFRARFITNTPVNRWPQPLLGRRKKARKPSLKNSIIPSSFRPHVLAAERLHAWTTPSTAPFHLSLTQALPPSDARALLEVRLLQVICH